MSKKEMDRKNNLYDKALEFGKEIILLYRDLEKNSVEKEISQHLLRSGTAIGANISEAQGSISEADYVSKIHVAYKELLETKYWLELFSLTGNIDNLRGENLSILSDELSKILYSIIKSIRQKKIQNQ